MIFERCTIDITQRFHVVVSDGLFCWSSPWQPEPWTNKQKRHVTTDTGRSSIDYWSLEGLHCWRVYTPAERHIWYVHILPSEYFGQMWFCDQIVLSCWYFGIRR